MTSHFKRRVGKKLCGFQWRKHGRLGFSPDESACWQLVFLQRPVSSLHPFPLPLLRIWHRQSLPLCVESCLEQIHLQDFAVDIVTDLSICTISESACLFDDEFGIPCLEIKS